MFFQPQFQKDIYNNLKFSHVKGQLAMHNPFYIKMSFSNRIMDTKPKILLNIGYVLLRLQFFKMYTVS